MLRKGGQPWIPRGPRGSGNDLVGDEALAYRAATNSIERAVRPLEKIKEQLNRLEQVRWEQSHPARLETFRTADGTTWDAYAHLVKLPKSRILLCRPHNVPDWFVIQEFEEASTYAKSHGRTEILAQGQNVRDVVMNYVAQANHTLRFVERNLVAKAQKMVWREFPQHNPGKVIEALMEWCDRAVTHKRSVGESQSEAQNIRQSRGIGV
jgi:hypothetical protein